MIYQPSDDSFLLEKQVKKFSKNKSVLDMGSGSGIQAKAAIESGAKSIICADINPEAIKLLKKQNIKAIKSNLFSNIKGKFDLIIFNPPYLPKDPREDKESALATTGGKKGDEIIIRFLKKSPQHLTKNGQILLLVSSLTPLRRIESTLEDFGLSKKELSKKKLFMESLEVWLITKHNNQ